MISLTIMLWCVKQIWDLEDIICDEASFLAGVDFGGVVFLSHPRELSERFVPRTDALEESREFQGLSHCHLAHEKIVLTDKTTRSFGEKLVQLMPTVSHFPRDLYKIILVSNYIYKLKNKK